MAATDKQVMAAPGMEVMVAPGQEQMEGAHNSADLGGLKPICAIPCCITSFAGAEEFAMGAWNCTVMCFKCEGACLEKEDETEDGFSTKCNIFHESCKLGIPSLTGCLRVSQQCCCIDSRAGFPTAGLMENNDTAMVCTLLPCCTICPAVGCCQTVGDLQEKKVASSG